MRPIIRAAAAADAGKRRQYRLPPGEERSREDLDDDAAQVRAGLVRSGHRPGWNAHALGMRPLSGSVIPARTSVADVPGPQVVHTIATADQPRNDRPIQERRL